MSIELFEIEARCECERFALADPFGARAMVDGDQAGLGGLRRSVEECLVRNRHQTRGRSRVVIAQAPHICRDNASSGKRRQAEGLVRRDRFGAPAMDDLDLGHLLLLLAFIGEREADRRKNRHGKIRVVFVVVAGGKRRDTVVRARRNPAGAIATDDLYLAGVAFVCLRDLERQTHRCRHGGAVGDGRHCEVEERRSERHLDRLAGLL